MLSKPQIPLAPPSNSHAPQPIFPLFSIITNKTSCLTKFTHHNLTQKYHSILQSIANTMSAIRMSTPRTLLSNQGCSYIGKTVGRSFNGSSAAASVGLKSSYYLLRPYSSPINNRNFSTTSKRPLEWFPPPRDAPSIRVTYVTQKSPT